LVGRDAQVGQQSINGLGFEVFQVGFGELKVVVYQRESGVVGNALKGVFVLVKGDQFAFGG